MAGTSSAEEEEVDTWDLPQGDPPGLGGIPQRGAGPCDQATAAVVACWDEGGIPLAVGLSSELADRGTLRPAERIRDNC